ncbi:MULTISPECIES: GlsB/YeaQ/YmgE family stress response membrane protein [Xanthobacter]|uniref:Transglycosylase n=1 Tax=Xanthobacter flavus TaxID=281 RepID=A0A9W6CL54_XANFL|nr:MULTISPECIES: GlsB/YeaQ/YmgE family stress response membrane protein [Xanthobacter]MBN8918870.1 GlsB/YeaQ/YmgE family stress response membrane protein [Hyphomicrobiales bacterium]MDR6332151.1 putative membrane protein YeaQ/YmgE (transglycosylase-associated protein family) [Xanthobacter flavus]NMN56432.1 putative membrane protein YeaQ/YmgE (transglycosylase-associated protein family) [Xanthobacter sp. SG618]UDQ88287.1 GlsB/YeaQ/YmgE family stress response membrane protein [Xanthobacter autotr
MDQQTYAFLSQPGVGFFSLIIIGVIAGWVAERVTASNHGLLTNLIVGVAGAFIGDKLAGVLNVPVHGFFRTLIAAIVGAIILLWVWRAIRSR